MNKKIYIFAIFVIIVSLLINHKFYGNSNSTISNYEVAKYYLEEEKKKKESQILADYIYSRIKYYQQYEDWYERTIRHLFIYNELNKEK